MYAVRARTFVESSDAGVSADTAVQPCLGNCSALVYHARTFEATFAHHQRQMYGHYGQDTTRPVIEALFV